MDKIKEFINWAISNEWDIDYNFEDSNSGLSQDVIDFYGSIPKDYLEFLQVVKSCRKKDKKAMFICGKDYLPIETPYGICYNEIEKNSYDHAYSDDNLFDDISAWWKNILPFVMILKKSSYEYYAFDYEENTIVYGTEPNFEEVYAVSSSFSDFLSKIIKGEIVI